MHFTMKVLSVGRYLGLGTAIPYLKNHMVTWFSAASLPVLSYLAARRSKHRHDEEFTDADVDDCADDLFGTLPLEGSTKKNVIVLVDSLDRSILNVMHHVRHVTGDENIVAFHVSLLEEAEKTELLQRQWDKLGLTVPLVIQHVPEGDILEPIIAFVRAEEQRRQPNEILVVAMPELITCNRFGGIYHNSTVKRIRDNIIEETGTAVVLVPYRLEK